MAHYYIKLGNDTLGPMTIAEIRLLVDQGVVKPATVVSTDKANWTPAFAVKGLVFDPQPSTPSVVSSAAAVTKQSRIPSRSVGLPGWAAYIGGAIGFVITFGVLLIIFSPIASALGANAVTARIGRICIFVPSLGVAKAIKEGLLGLRWEVRN